MAQQVLLVQDSTSQNRALSDELIRCGYLVWSVSSEEDAISAIQSVKPHVIIASWNIAGIDGHEMVRELRRRFQFLMMVPTIIVTNRQLAEDTVRQLWVDGFRHVVPSPPPVKELLNYIRRSQGSTAILRIQRHSDSSVVT